MAEKLTEMGLVIVVGAIAISLLPSSPFTYFINAIQSMPYLGILNWFVPVSTLLAIGQAWLSAITVYYLLSIILRFIKAIE